MTESRTSVAVGTEYPDLYVHAEDLSRLFQRLGAAPQEVADFIQQTFTQVLERIRAGEVIGNPGGYCFMVGTHLYVSSRRRKGISLVDFDSEVLEQPPLQPNDAFRNEPLERVLAGEEINELVRDADAALGDQGSKVFQLERVEGFDDQETADRLGLSKHAVRRHKTKINKWCKAKKEGK